MNKCIFHAIIIGVLSLFGCQLALSECSCLTTFSEPAVNASPSEGNLERGMKHTLYTLEGRPITLQKLVNKPVFLTALYTTCSNPYKCPATAKWVSSFAKKEGVKNFNIVLISFIKHDSEKIRKAYAKKYDFPSNVLFLRAETPQEFFKDIGYKVMYNGEIVSIHSKQYILINKASKVESFREVDWDETRIMKVLKLIE